VHSSHFNEQPAVQAPGGWSPKKQTINSASLKSTDLKNEGTLFFSTPNEKFEVEKTIACFVQYF